jgi:hypothetical protein
MGVKDLSSWKTQRKRLDAAVIVKAINLKQRRTRSTERRK